MLPNWIFINFCTIAIMASFIVVVAIRAAIQAAGLVDLTDGATKIVWSQIGPTLYVEFMRFTKEILPDHLGRLTTPILSTITPGISFLFDCMAEALPLGAGIKMVGAAILGAITMFMMSGQSLRMWVYMASLIASAIHQWG